MWITLIYYNSKCYQLILKIQEFHQEGCSDTEIARRLGISRNTVRKYMTGSPKLLCQYGIRQNKLDIYRGLIIQCLDDGFDKSKTLKTIYEHGNDGGKTNANNNFYNSRVIKDLDEFRKMSDIIVVNKMVDDIKDVADKVYTRDLFSRD